MRAPWMRQWLRVNTRMKSKSARACTSIAVAIGLTSGLNSSDTMIYVWYLIKIRGARWISSIVALLCTSINKCSAWLECCVCRSAGEMITVHIWSIVHRRLSSRQINGWFDDFCMISNWTHECDSMRHFQRAASRSWIFHKFHVTRINTLTKNKIFHFHFSSAFIFHYFV